MLDIWSQGHFLPTATNHLTENTTAQNRKDQVGMFRDMHRNHSKKTVNSSSVSLRAYEDSGTKALVTKPANLRWSLGYRV